MNATRIPAHALTAGEVMSCDLVVVPRQMLVRQAAGLLHQAPVSAAAVVDEDGRCVGMLSPTDVYRWVAAGCPETVVGPALTCPYQVRGRLLTGGEAVICTLADGGCPYQAKQPTMGGRYTEICMRPENEPAPLGTPSCYATTEVVTVRPAVLLRDLVRQLIDTRADRAVVLDEFDRPIGLVSATDVLTTVAKQLIAEP